MKCVAIAVGLACVVALAGCTSSSGHKTTSNQTQAGQLSAAQIEHDITAVKLTDAKSLHRLDLDAEQPDAAAAAKQILAGTPSDAAAWGAAYVYLGAGTDPAPLHKLLTDTSLDVRALAAAGTVTEGGKDGFPVLIDMLGHAEFLRGSEPPLALWQFAALTLVRVTGDASRGPSTGASAYQARAAQQRWQAWWAANQAKLTWNKSEQLWVTS